MMKKVINILLFLFVSFSAMYPQILLPPYHFEPVDTFYNYYSGQGNFFSKTSVDYVFLTPAKNLKYRKSIAIINSKSKNLTKIKLNNFRIYPKLFIDDFDADSLSEMIYVLTGNYKLVLKYFDAKDSYKLFELKIPKASYNGSVFVIPAQLDEDKAKEVLIIIASVAPVPGSIRGMFAVDVQTKKLLWKTYFADNISAYHLFEKQQNKLIALFSFARNDQMHYANGKFYVKRLPKYENIYVNENAQDYSCDSASYMKIFDLSNGSLVYRKRLGGKGVKIIEFKEKLNDYDFVANLKHISIGNKEPDKLLGFKENDFSLTTLIEYPHNLQTAKRVVDFASPNILQISDSTAIIVKNGRLGTIKLKFPSYIRIYEYLRTAVGNVFVASNAVESLLFGEDQQVLAKLQTRLRLHYLENSGNIFYRKYTINKKHATVFYKLTKTSFFARIPTKLYLYLTILLVGLFLFLVILWAATLLISLRKIKRQSVELEATTSKLLQAEKLSALGMIAGSIAHQINSPLGAILNSARRLQRKNSEEPNVKLILEAGERIKTIVQKFLVTTQPSKDDERGVPFIEVYDAWRQLFAHDFGSQYIKIEEEINDGDTVLPLTRNEINEIINNLMFNARDAVIKAKPNGERIIRIMTQKENKHFIIRISDNGGGFTEDFLKKGIQIFETTKERGKGTGLGLWILTVILKNVSGKIELSNNEEGAVVTVKIPLKKQKR